MFKVFTLALYNLEINHKNLTAGLTESAKKYGDWRFLVAMDKLKDCVELLKESQIYKIENPIKETNKDG